MSSGTMVQDIGITLSFYFYLKLIENSQILVMNVPGKTIVVNVEFNFILLKHLL